VARGLRRLATLSIIGQCILLLWWEGAVHEQGFVHAAHVEYLEIGPPSASGVCLTRIRLGIFVSIFLGSDETPSIRAS